MEQMEGLARPMRSAQREDGRTVEQTFSTDDLKRIHQRLDENDPASRGGTESEASTSGPIAGCNNAQSVGTRAQARIFAREARKSVGGQVSSSDDSADDMHATGQGPGHRPSGKDSSQRIVDQLSLSTHPSAALPDGPSFQQSIEGRQRALRSEKVCGRCLCCKEFEVQMQRLADEIKRYPMWALIQELERLQLELEYFENHAQNFQQAKADIAEQKQRNEKVRQADLERIAALEAQCSADKDALVRMHEADGATIHQLQDELQKLALEQDRECSELKALLKTKEEELKKTLQPSPGSLPEMPKLEAIPKLDLKPFHMPSMPWGVEGWGGGMLTLLSGRDEGQGDSDIEVEGKAASLQEEVSQLRQAIAAAAGANDALEVALGAAARAAHGGRGAAMRALESEVSQAKKALLEAERVCNAHAMASEKLSDRVVELEQLLNESVTTAQIQSNSQAKQLTATLSAEKARRIALAQRIVRRILHNQLAVCWGSFCTRVTETKRKREACQRVVLRLQHRATATAWDAFTASIEQRKTHRVKVQRTLARWRAPMLRMGFDMWLEYGAACRLEAIESAKAQLTEDLQAARSSNEQDKASLSATVSAEKARRIALAQRIVRRILHNQLAVCWGSFCTRVTETKRKREACQRVVLRLQHRATATAWDAFTASIEQRKTHRVKVQRTLARWRAPMLRMGFDMWLEYGAACRLEAIESAKAQLTEDLQAARSSNEQDKASLSATVSAEKARRIALAQRIVRRILHNQLAVCWGSFCTRVTETKRKREACQRVVLRLQHRATATAWDAFTASIEQRKTHRVKVQRTLARWRAPMLRMGFDMWLEYGAACRLEAIESAKAQLTEDLQAARSSNEQDKASLSATVSAEKARRIALAQRIVRRILHNQLAVCWGSFCTRVTETKRKREACQRVVLRLQHRATATAWDAFTASIEQRKTHRVKVQRTLARWRAPMLRMGFDMWLEYGAACRLEAIESAKAQLTEDLQAARSSNEQDKASLSATVSAEKARRIALAQRIVRRILHNQLAVCWGSFCTRVTETKRKREACQRVVLRIRKLALTKAFDLFRSSVAQLKTHRVKVQRTLARLRSPLVPIFYDEWHRHVECEKESRRRASQQAAMAELKRTLTLEQKNNKSLMQNIADRGERVVTQERVVEIPVEVIVYKDRLVEVPVKSIQTVEVIKHIHVDNKAAVESQLELVKADLAASEALNEELRAAMEEMRVAVEQRVAEMEHRLQLELEEMVFLNDQDNHLSQDLLERLLAEREHKKEIKDSQMQTAWRLGGGEKPPTKDAEVQTFAGMQGLAYKTVGGAQNDPRDRERAAFGTEDVLPNIPAVLDSARSAVSAPPPTPGRTVHYENAVTPNGPVAARTLGDVDASLGQVTGDVSSQMSMEAQVRNLNPLANFKAPGMEIPLLSHFPAMSVPVLPGFGFFSGNAMSGSKAETDGDECHNVHTSPKDEVKGALVSPAEDDRDPLNEEGFSARLERARKELAGVPGLRREAWQPLSFSSLQFASNGPGDVSVVE